MKMSHCLFSELRPGDLFVQNRGDRESDAPVPYLVLRKPVKQEKGIERFNRWVVFVSHGSEMTFLLCHDSSVWLLEREP